MARKKESLKEEIVAIGNKAKQMKEELSNMGLDDMIEKQERFMIAAVISNEFWDAVK